MSKTVSSRLENKVHSDLIERCNKVGCNINEFVGESVKMLLYNESDFDFGMEEDEDDKQNNKNAELQTSPIENKSVKSRIFTIKNGRMTEDGKDIGSTINFTLNQGKAYDKKTGKFLGNIDNTKPYVVFIDD